MSASDLAIVFTKLGEQEKAQDTVGTIKSVAVTERDAAAKVVQGSAVAITEDIFCAPKFQVAAFKCNTTISKKLCDITEFPEFAMTSHLTIRFRQCDEKVFIPDLLVVMGKYPMVSEAHVAVLRLMEIKHVCVKDLASLEIDNNLSLVLGKSIILMLFPDATKLLHRLGVCTVDRDASLVVPKITVSIGLVAPKSTASAVSGAAKGGLVAPKSTTSTASGVVKGGLVAPKSTASAVSGVVKGGLVAPKSTTSAVSGAAKGGLVAPQSTASVVSGVVKGGLVAPKSTTSAVSGAANGGLVAPKSTTSAMSVAVKGGLVAPKSTTSAVSGAVKGGLVAPQSTASVVSGVVKGDVAPKSTASVASVAVKGVVVSKSTASIASEATKGLVAPKSTASAASSAVKMRIRMRKVPASVLKTIPSFENLDDSCALSKVVRQIEEGEIDDKGIDIGGMWNLQDVGTAYLYDDSKNANRWAKGITTADASSLIKIPSGNPSVSEYN